MIAKCKHGDCSVCGAKDTDVVKLKKDLVCLRCNKEIKVKQYEANQRVKSKVRLLGKKQVQEGNYFEAERAAIIQDLDWVTSRIVRLMAANEKGIVFCYTCDKPVHWSIAQASHFIKRSETALRFNFRLNLRASCRYCNENLGGNLEAFAARLEQEQKGLPEQLQEQAREPYKWSREELKQLLIDYRARLRVLEAKVSGSVN